MSTVLIQRRSVRCEQSAIEGDLRAMEFQVDGPMKPNLKADLMFSVAHFPIGVARRSRFLEPYSIRINESGSRTLSPMRTVTRRKTRAAKKHGDNLVQDAFAAGCK
jgi:hypothetical protein